jgi:hypothetical protein
VTHNVLEITYQTLDLQRRHLASYAHAALCNRFCLRNMAGESRWAPDLAQEDTDDGKTSRNTESATGRKVKTVPFGQSPEGRYNVHNGEEGSCI